jgi:N-methylhydantoinase A
MVVAGGAGPNHACAIAAELEMPLFLVPRDSSIFCAAGMLMTDLKHDVVKSLIARLDELPESELQAAADELADRGRAILISENVAEDRIRVDTTAEMRYVGQYHEVSLPLFPLDSLATRFHAEHNRLYGYSLDEEGTAMELINLAARAIGETDKPRLLSAETGGPDAEHARKGERRVWLPGAGDFVPIPVYDGHGLLPGNRLAGPAIVEQQNTTLFVAEEFDVVTDAYGSFVVYARERADALPEGLL